ncbi:glycoside hydrolase family 18 protein [Mongoliitalea daihaiensis]|uniref:glycoside hydrolase family 18 protein n=1 Tax=Mongoliitalea daihaiensis TaxID=2782006 RepID=UPI001F27099B|nr:glycoside hydrolase family 18 protein [Mongoliitalea daihaiensis]UJP63254.1 glycoside hydrolase family 18 protein [Mongoliitalea daihaiensis]
MKKLLFLIIGFGLLQVISCTSKPNSFQEPPYKLIGYIAGWKNLDVSSIDPFAFTHINYAFANVVDGLVTEGEGRFEQDSTNLVALNSLKAINPELKILISIGGWTWSKGFSDAVLTPEGRKRLTDSAIDYLLKHRLDGLDFDWEYPGIPGDDNPYRDEDRENFVWMLQSVRKALDSLGALHHRHYLHTIASGGFQEYVDANNLGEAQKYLDFINIMTYDFTGVWAPKTGHHTNLSAPKPNMRSTRAAVRQHLEAGVPAEKLVVGVAFYGKAWKSVNPENNGLNQEAVGWKNFSFKDMQSYIADENYQKLWDEASQAPYLWNPLDSIFFTYENEQSIQSKVAFVKELGLGGMMFWEYHEDSEDHTLLKAMNRYLSP